MGRLARNLRRAATGHWHKRPSSSSRWSLFRVLIPARSHRFVFCHEPVRYLEVAHPLPPISHFAKTANESGTHSPQLLIGRVSGAACSPGEVAAPAQKAADEG